MTAMFKHAFLYAYFLKSHTREYNAGQPQMNIGQKEGIIYHNCKGLFEIVVYLQFTFIKWKHLGTNLLFYICICRQRCQVLYFTKLCTCFCELLH